MSIVAHKIDKVHYYVSKLLEPHADAVALVELCCLDAISDATAVGWFMWWGMETKQTSSGEYLVGTSLPRLYVNVGWGSTMSIGHSDTVSYPCFHYWTLYGVLTSGSNFQNVHSGFLQEPLCRSSSLILLHLHIQPLCSTVFPLPKGCSCRTNSIWASKVLLPTNQSLWLERPIWRYFMNEMTFTEYDSTKSCKGQVWWVWILRSALGDSVLGGCSVRSGQTVGGGILRRMCVQDFGYFVTLPCWCFSMSSMNARTTTPDDSNPQRCYTGISHTPSV